MDTETKIELLKDFSEEILTEEDLRVLLQTNSHPLAYDGFEPSGIAPIHFGLLRATNLKTMFKVGFKFRLYLADYFAFINNKLGGDLDAIRAAGKYFVEIWKACGIDTKKVEIVWAKDIMDDINYWDKMLKVSKQMTIARALRATTVAGRTEGESSYLAQIMYPAMQITDIFDMGVDICQLGMDQRRAHVLAREIAPKYGWKKPVAIHHHIILGLQGAPPGMDKDKLIEMKMSKSKPKTCIYMHNTFEELKEKLNGAYCPIKTVDGNPVLEYLKHIIFKEFKDFEIERPSKYGGDISFGSYSELESAYVNGLVHPMDLKLATAVYLDKLIKPVREYFEKNKKAAKLFRTVRLAKITR